MVMLDLNRDKFISEALSFISASENSPEKNLIRVKANIKVYKKNLFLVLIAIGLILIEGVSMVLEKAFLCIDIVLVLATLYNLVKSHHLTKFYEGVINYGEARVGFVGVIADFIHFMEDKVRIRVVEDNFEKTDGCEIGYGDIVALSLDEEGMYMIVKNTPWGSPSFFKLSKQNTPEFDKIPNTFNMVVLNQFWEGYDKEKLYSYIKDKVSPDVFVD